MPGSRVLGRLLAAVTCVLALAGCGSQTGDAGGGPAGSNDADVSFATEMIPHHRLAVRLADLAERQASDPRVLRLAKEIKYARQPEIDTMSGWLREWSEPVPDVDASSTGPASGPVSGPVSGPLSEQQLSALEQVRGPAFDRRWLELMLAHHRDAVARAQTEVDQGADGAALALAQDIVESQRGEIERMRWLLSGGLSRGGGGIGW